jgi:hypothetical protein
MEASMERWRAQRSFLQEVPDGCSGLLLVLHEIG